MLELRSRLSNGGLDLLYSGSIQKLSNWGKWNNRNVVLTKSRDSRFEISYNKDKSPSSVRTVRLSSRSTVQSMEKDGLVFQVVPEPESTPYKFRVQNRKERLVWVKKLKEILTSLRGLSPRRSKVMATLDVTSRGGSMSSIDGTVSNLSGIQSDTSSNDLATPRGMTVSVEDAEQDRKRGWSLDQLVEEIKNQKKDGRTKKKKCILKNHYRNGVCYRNCFSGKRIVEWLIQNGFEKNRADAASLVQNMIDRGMVNHVDQIGRPFEDNSELFVFTESHVVKLQNLKKLMKRMHYHVEELDLQIHQLENNQDSTWNRARRIDREAGDQQFESMCTICVLSFGLLFQGFQDYTLSLSGLIGLIVFSIYGKRLLRLYLSNTRRSRALSVGLPSAMGGSSPRHLDLVANDYIQNGTPTKAKSKVWKKSKDEMTDLKRARGLTRQMSSMHVSNSSKTNNFTTPTKKLNLRRRNDSERFDDDDEEEKIDTGSVDTLESVEERTLWLPYDEEDGVISDCWSQPDASKFKVRGQTYLTDGIKINSARSAFQCLAVHLCRVRTKIDHVAERTYSWRTHSRSSYHYSRKTSKQRA